MSNIKTAVEIMKSVGGLALVKGKGMVWNFGLLSIGAAAHTPMFASAAPHLKNYGAGKVCLLYEAARTVMGQDLDPGPQKIGDCVSWGFAGVCDLVASVQAVNGTEAFSWEQRACTEAIYALSRVEVGGQQGSYSDGSTGDWGTGAVTKYGVNSRKQLGAYDPQRAKQWGAKGLPDEYEPVARQHPIRTATLVTDFEQARDGIAAGHPIAVCSDVGFETGQGGAATRRDARGFSKPRGSWNHCMKFIASRDDGTPGLLCMQSWGKDASADGPKGDFEIPDHSWWVEPAAVNRMLAQRDSYILSAFIGYPALSIPWMF